MFNPTRGTRGIAVAPHSLASQSALAVLREGGNAVEAMIAAAATIAVVYPHMNGIGGDSFWLIAQPNGEVTGIEGCGAAALAVRNENYAGLAAIPARGGRAAITVAGTLSAWDLAWRFSSNKLGGTLPLSRLLRDACEYAARGVPVTISQYRNTAKKLDELKAIPGFTRTFCQSGEPPAVGAVFTQPRLAQTLEQLLRAGLDDFYRGDLARVIARDLQALGSPVSLTDLTQHEALYRQPLKTHLRGGTVYNMPPPTQGVVSLLILAQLDRLGVDRFTSSSADFIHAAVESTKQAFRIRDRHITDPRYMQIDIEHALSDRALIAMSDNIHMSRAAPWGAGRGPGDTVWMGVIDNEGRACSMIQSIYHEFGAGIVLENTGINWQNRGASFSLDPAHVNALAPGKKPFHTLNPALARLSDGRLMAYGTMGGDGQPQTQAAVFIRASVMGMNPQQAITEPRWLLGRTWGQSSDTLKLESRFPQAVMDELRRRGHEVEVLSDFDETFGHAGCVMRHANGMFEGGFDVRSDGGVAAW